MKQVTLILLTLLVFVSYAHAQEKQQQYKVLFESDKYNLSETDKGILDEVAMAASTAKYYEIALSAHTDYEGSQSYNQQLSARRAQSVRAYLAARGLDSTRISDAWYGEKKPAATNSTEEGMQLNRRVEVNLYTYDFTDVNGLLQQAGGNYMQQFSLQSDDAQTITGKNGTRIDIPADAFILPDGTPVKNSEVQISLQEYSSAGDAIVNKLSTQSNGQMLESGGMMKLTATYKGQELQLVDDKNLAVLMPSANLQPGMTVFAGVQNTQGKIDWVDTKSNFRVKDTCAVRPALQINTQKLRSFMVPLPGIPQVDMADKSVKVPQRPAAPAKPSAPRAPVRPNPDNLVFGLPRIFIGEKGRERMADRKYQEALANYNERMAKYDERMEAYSHKLEQYEKDTADFREKVVAFHIELDKMISACQAQQGYIKKQYDALRWNRAVVQMAKLCEAGKFYDIGPLQWLVSRSINATDFELGKQLVAVESYIQFYQDMKFTDVDIILKKYSDKGRLNLAMYRHVKEYTNESLANLLFYDTQNSNEVATAMKSNKDLLALLNEAGMRLGEAQEAAGLVSKASLNSVYSASINRLGYINCDRFSTTPPDQMVKVKIINPANAEVSVCVDRYNSVLYPSTDKDGNLELSLPKGEKITVVAVTVKDGRPAFEKRQVTVADKGQRITMLPQPIKIRELSMALASL